MLVSGSGGRLRNDWCLFGDVNPGGKLSISFPRSAGHIPAYYNYKPTSRAVTIWASMSPAASVRFWTQLHHLPATEICAHRPYDYGRRHGDRERRCEKHGQPRRCGNRATLYHRWLFVAHPSGEGTERFPSHQSESGRVRLSLSKSTRTCLPIMTVTTVGRWSLARLPSPQVLRRPRTTNWNWKLNKQDMKRIIFYWWHYLCIYFRLPATWAILPRMLKT